MRIKLSMISGLALLAVVGLVALPSAAVAQNWDWGVTPYVWLPGAGLDIKVNDSKFDPFIGAGLGYLIVSSSYNGTGFSNGSGIYFIGRAGLRYYMATALPCTATSGPARRRSMRD